MTLPKPLTILIGSAFALAALPAMADSASNYDIKSVEISTSEYDLTETDDAQRLYSKIKRAAKRACNRTGVRQSLRELAEERTCRDDAIERAVAQLNEPVLTYVMNEANRSS